ncbi:mycofactocin system transcriptional regulator [Thermocrispum sp.]|uniref:Mycofactocin system transcriptional regulator n=2 Tax=Thermocrispum agreste TaxID=37925 RepID=A0A2W4JRQ4_9PSEU|nr:mycofactocin system transcriptional regulator [Thermocrispum sp.]PZN01082.1 MAG: mycofactocin system transcriptional regulator [Thermocrispum agreste]
MGRRTSGNGARRGRRPATSRAELERVAFELFAERGFDATTIDDIAAAANIGRRTFFRYFDSKNDVVWGNFTEQLASMRSRFASCPPDQPLMEAIRDVVVDFNRFDPQVVPWHRRRMELILKVPALQAHSTLRYADWRAVVAEFVAQRLGTEQDALLPRAISHATLGVCIAAYEHWLLHPDTDLCDVLSRMLAELAAGFGASVAASTPER